MEARTPEWVKDAVFYQIFPDRFARSERARKPSGLEAWDSPPTRFGYKGGDLYGVAEKMDYLHDLGVTAIYFNPVFQSASNHRYHTQDYFRIDPLLGGEEAFDAMLEAAHARGIKVVLDGVFNHASRGMYEFQQTLENGSSSPYLDWFYFDEQALAPGVGPHAYPEPLVHRSRVAAAGPDNPAARGGPGGGPGHAPSSGADNPAARDSPAAPGQPPATDDQHPNAAGIEQDTGLTIRDGGSLARYGYEAWWDIPALPKLNTDTPQVREFLLSVGEYWIRRGADGWRLDVPGEIDDDEFWREFRRRVKAANPEAYIVGEIWTHAERWLSGDQFDAVMNYVFNRLCYQFFGGHALDPEHDSPGGHKLGPIDAETFAAEYHDLERRYHHEITQAQLNLLSSHDEPRFITVVSRDQAAFRLATAFQMTVAGAPCIYYGDEIGLEGGSDPDCRGTFPEDDSQHDHALREFVQSLAHLRHEHTALRRGSHHTVLARGHIYGFLRTHAEGWALVLFNAGLEAWSQREQQEQKVDVSTLLGAVPAEEKRPTDGELTPVFGNARATLTDGSLHDITLPPQSFAVFAG